MGILTVQFDDKYVVSSDRCVTDAPVNRPPKGKPSADNLVWTGGGWSRVRADAMTFGTLDEADEYVKANYARLNSG